MININFTKAIVLLGVGGDKVMLETDLPSPFPKISNQNLSLDFQTERDKGVEYVRKYFGMESELINIRQ